MATTTIKADDIPLDKLEAVIDRLQKEKDARIDRAVEAGEAIKVNVDILGDEDVEMAKERALRDYGISSDMPIHFNVIRYRYPEFCSDGVTPNPMNGPSRLRDAIAGDYAQPASTSHRYDDDVRYPKPSEPPPLILGEPHPVWTEIRRPGPHHHGEIAEGFYLVDDGRVHLCDELGKAIHGYSDIAGLDPMNKARKLLRGKAMRERPDEFWAPMRPAQHTGGW
jgi:hypothetical protein